MVNYGKKMRREMKSSVKTVYDLPLATTTVFSFLKLCLTSCSRNHATWLENALQGNGGGTGTLLIHVALRSSLLIVNPVVSFCYMNFPPVAISVLFTQRWDQRKTPPQSIYFPL